MPKPGIISLLKWNCIEKNRIWSSKVAGILSSNRFWRARCWVCGRRWARFSTRRTAPPSEPKMSVCACRITHVLLVSSSRKNFQPHVYFVAITGTHSFLVAIILYRQNFFSNFFQKVFFNFSKKIFQIFQKKFSNFSKKNFQFFCAGIIVPNSLVDRLRELLKEGWSVDEDLPMKAETLSDESDKEAESSDEWAGWLVNLAVVFCFGFVWFFSYFDPFLYYTPSHWTVFVFSSYLWNNGQLSQFPRVRGFGRTQHFFLTFFYSGLVYFSDL